MPDPSIQTLIRELKTLRDLLRYSLTQFYKANLFYGHGTDNAWDEAVYLASSAINLPPDINSAVLDAQLLRTERKRILELVQERVEKRIPAAYLTNQAWFCGIPFYVDERVIIPRSPMAELIEKEFSPWIQQPEQIERILDLCTGSACIAVASALYMPQVTVEAVDISKSALEVAQKNINDHQVENRVTAIHSDLFQKLNGKTYDIIISNPPYVGEKEFSMLPKEYSHEPEMALKAGKTGLEIVTNILKNAIKHLSPNGFLIVEVGDNEAALIDKYPKVPFTWLDFERGGGGVFLLTTEQLEKYQHVW